MKIKSSITIMLAVILLLSLIVMLDNRADAQSGGCGFNQYNDYVCSRGDGGTTFNPFDPGGSSGGGSPPTGGGTPIDITPPVSDPLPACESGSGDAFDQFKEHLKLREGVVNCVYRDSLGKPTVGVGHLVLPEDNLSVGDCISDDQVNAFLDKDSAWAWNAAQSQAAEAGITDSCFIIALGSVNYQLGTGWRSKFPTTWGLIVNGDYCTAANGLEGSLWNRQTPVRVDDFQRALRDEAALQGNPC